MSARSEAMSWLRARGGALVLLVCCLAAGPARAAEAETEARSLLGLMAEAARELTYDGVFIYQRGSRTDTMRVIHRAEGEEERERLVSLTGPAREVIRDAKSVTCIFPEDRAVMVERARPRKLFVSAFAQPLDALADRYVFALLGQDRVAGRDARVVAVRPILPHRYGHTLWIDRETHLLLKSTVVDAAGKVLEQTMFTEIEFPAQVPDSDLEPSLVGEGFTWYRNTSEESGGSSDDGEWTVEWLPEGFALSEFRIEPMAASTQPVRQLSFSDGLATISVFIEPFDSARQVMEGFSALGAVNTYGLRAGEHQVTVVGDVPPLALRLVADSVLRTRE